MRQLGQGVRVCRDLEELSSVASDEVAKYIGEAVKRRGRAMVALSGGSTPERMYRKLAEKRVDWERTFLFFGDERFVPKNDPRSNFGMVQRTLLRPASVPADHLFPVPCDAANPESAALAYEATLRRVFGAASEPVVFDLIILGLGSDGHTASLFPNAASLAEQKRWVISSPPGRLPPSVDRVTLTLPVLNAARQVLFLAAGAEKSKTFREVLQGQERCPELPAACVHPLGGCLEWVVDEGAASQLDI